MPAVASENPAVFAVAEIKKAFKTVLEEVAVVKPGPNIEPALKKTDFKDLYHQISDILSHALESSPNDDTNNQDSAAGKQFSNAIIETAARELFGELVATTSVTSPAFVKVWNLFDVLSILSDDEQCDPALLFWLIEELLDSQTIAGCRKIFDYLESRREQITGRHFKQKSLVILRMCNELLRRLSRAEDTGFCGRVYIFLFQSFPLGDRSSVNLRGEFHIENVTIYEDTSIESGSGMDVDAQVEESKKPEESSQPTPKGASETKDSKNKPLDAEELYPHFWSLQESFSQPMNLFDKKNFSKFKDSLGATMKLFTSHPVEGSTAAVAKQSDESKMILKRKRNDEAADLAEAFNPKYLTSKDLFQLEVC